MTKCYRLYHTESLKIFFCRNIVFNESNEKSSMENIGTTSLTEVSFSQAGDNDSPPTDIDSLISKN